MNEIPSFMSSFEFLNSRTSECNDTMSWTRAKRINDSIFILKVLI